MVPSAQAATPSPPPARGAAPFPSFHPWGAAHAGGTCGRAECLGLPHSAFAASQLFSNNQAPHSDGGSDTRISPSDRAGQAAGGTTAGVHISRWQQQSHAKHLNVLVAGCVAGAVSRTMTAPLDRLKMLLQVHRGPSKLTLKEAVARMVREGSESGLLAAFFRGNGANVLKIAPELGLKLYTNDVLKHQLADEHGRITAKQRLLAGATGGVVAQASVYPLDMLKTRLATAPPGMYSGVLHAAKRVLAQEGVGGFYRGIAPCLLGVVPYAAVEIALYESLKLEYMRMYNAQPPAWTVLLLGTGSASVGQLVSYPFALIRTRLQAQGQGGGKRVRYSGFVHACSETVRTEGFTGLYKGLLPNFLKLAPSAAISWLVFEKTKQLLGDSRHL